MKRLYLYLRGRQCLSPCGEGHTYGVGCLLR